MEFLAPLWLIFDIYLPSGSDDWYFLLKEFNMVFRGRFSKIFTYFLEQLLRIKLRENAEPKCFTFDIKPTASLCQDNIVYSENLGI